MGAFMSYFLVPREREMTRLLLKVVMQTTRWVADDLGLVIHDDPAARVGVLLNAARSMTELVDTGLLHTLPGAVPSGQFLGYAIADRTGRPASDIARTMLAQLCEYTLHLGDFEPALARTLNARQPRNTTKKHGTPRKWATVIQARSVVRGTHKGHHCQEGVRIWPGGYVLPSGLG